MEFYVDNKGEHRWRLRTKSGDTYGASSEGFTAQAKCAGNAAVLFGVLDRYINGANPKGTSVEIFTDRSPEGHLHWRAKAANGEIVGASSEQLTTFSRAGMNIARVWAALGAWLESIGIELEDDDE